MTGLATGPRPEPCPAGVAGLKRMGFAFNAILYHELILVTLAGVVGAISWNCANQVGLATFGLLWIMRLSAKFNLFLGVPMLNAEFLPRDIAFLKSYFTRKSMNGLFPVSFAGCSLLVVWLAGGALDPDAGSFAATAYALLTVLAALALLEHAFMVLPIPISRMWEWLMREPFDASEP